MVRCKLLLLVVVAFVCGEVHADLKTKKGVIKGTVRKSRAGRPYHSYTAVPYAQPPLGQLRLKNPKPHRGWEGVLDATKEAPVCTQVDWFTPHGRNKTTGQEDCLYINIYTPTSSSKTLPVMVFVHGGAFRCGSPGPKEGPAFFMDEDVVLVTIQYRLGTLGFLSTEDSVIPGNFGLKDQAMALKWINENIDDYGGNPDSIVVFGNSAGAASVHYLISSPLSRDLIHGGISQSGTLDAPWAFAPPDRAKKNAKRLINMVGCNSSPLLECLQSVPPEKLISSESEFIEWDFDPSVNFQPVIEVKNEGAFMTQDPRTIKVTLPWITGITNGEGNMRSSGLINQDESVLDYFIENIDKVLPALLFVEPRTLHFDQFLVTVKNRYFRNPTRNYLSKQHEKLFFELNFAYPMKRALDRHIGPKYAYFFSHRAENSLADLMGPIKLNSSKASHGDDLLSLFDFSSKFPNSKERPEDIKFSEHLVKLWVDFAKSVNSNGEDFKNRWVQYSKDKMLHLKTEDSRIEQIKLYYVVDFWSKAYSLLKPIVIKDEL